METTRLNTAEIMQAYPELATLPDGEQVKRNHVGCPAGRDTKGRLYVKRDGGRLLLYCHHCKGKAGSSGAPRRHIRDGKNVVEQQRVTLPPDLTMERSNCSVHCNAWLSKYGITQEEMRYYGVGWSEREGRVILPVSDVATGELLAYQRRRVLAGDDGPKYLTTRAKWVKHPVFMGSNPAQRRDLLVIVEDILSAIVVGRVAPSMALLGTHLPDHALHVAAQYSDVVLWLDNDNPQVRKDQRTALRRLEQYTAARMVLHDRDPKELSAAEITQLVYVTSNSNSTSNSTSNCNSTVTGSPKGNP